MRGRILAATLAAAVSLVAPAAKAAVIQDFPDFTSATNGIVLGPDGNFWVAQEFNDQGVERMTPAGQILQRFPLTGDVTSLINGPGGRVWAAVTGDDKLVWFDATSPSPTPHTISTSSAGDCGPVGMAAGGGDNRIYFTLPHAGTCATASRVATMADNGTGAISFAGSLGTAF